MTAFSCFRRAMRPSSFEHQTSRLRRRSWHRWKTSPMWYLRKTDPLSAILGNKHVSFVGGGGKTSFAEGLAVRALQQGRSVAITTTTKIWARPPFATLDHGPWQGDGRFLRIGKTEEKGKLTGLLPEEVEAIGNDF